MPDNFSYEFFSDTASAWQAMFEAIARAQKLVYWEVYMFLDDEQGKKYVALLCEKARAGVEIKLILDAVGSMEFTASAERELRLAGVEIVWYNPIFPRHFFRRWRERLWQRNHRKVLVIDGENGFVGGVNVHVAHRNWNDLHLRISGDTVRSLLYGFARSYIKSGGDKMKMRAILHPRLALDLPEWRNKIKFFFHSPNQKSKRDLQQFFFNAMEAAKTSVTLLTPYYVPNRDFLRLLERATRRGIRIDLLVPARSDIQLMDILAQKYFQKVHEMGVNIYLSDQMNHSKAMVVDDNMGMVGSVNLTKRSFDINEEVGAYFTNVDMVNDLNKILSGWKEKAQPFALVKLHARGWWWRFKAWWADRIEKYV